MRIAAALLLVGASGCWVSTEQGRQLEARIHRLEGEAELSAKQIDEQRAAVRERIAVVDQKIAEVQKKLNELNATAHRTGADLAVNQDRLLEDMARVRGQLEEEAHRLETLEKALAEQKQQTDARFAALKGAGALEEYEARRKAEQIRRPTDKNEFLALAQQQEAAGERAVARELYEDFVKKWPSDPRAADAYFRIGELWFGDKRYREAILSYGKVVQDFPRSDKAPDALFRTGESMLGLKMQGDARTLFEEVQKRYPGTTAARRARTRLAELGKRGR